MESGQRQAGECEVDVEQLKNTFRMNKIRLMVEYGCGRCIDFWRLYLTVFSELLKLSLIIQRIKDWILYVLQSVSFILSVVCSVWHLMEFSSFSDISFPQFYGFFHHLRTHYMVISSNGMGGALLNQRSLVLRWINRMYMGNRPSPTRNTNNSMTLHCPSSVPVDIGGLPWLSSS